MKDPLKLQRDGFSLAECHHIISLSSINYSLIPSFHPRQLLTFTDSYPLINMQARQQKASEWSGVGTSDAFAIDDSNLFDKLGLQSFVKLSTNFYNRVYDDEEEWFRSIFANSKKQDAIQNQYEFLAQRMGGPPLYSQRRGHPALIARHRTFPVTHEAAERWLYHMQQAMASTREIGEESKIKIMNFLRHTAYFLVAGVDELKNQNQEMHPCGHGAGAQHPCKNF